MSTGQKPHVESDSIGGTYLKALRLVSEKKPYQYMTVHVSKPIKHTSVKKPPKSLNIDDWCEIINVGSIYENFCKYPFAIKCGKGHLGKDWINDRIDALLSPQGFYNKRLEKQLQMVNERLRVHDKNGKKMHGSSTNALLCQVFSSEDLERACKPRPNARNLPCLTMLDFKPKKDRLNLLAVFRSQYFDTKAYGNFISLAILLYKICRETGYEYGFLISTANNVTFHSWKHHRKLCDFLLHPEKTKHIPKFAPPKRTKTSCD